MSALIACAECRRHARSSEPDCPFCGASLRGLTPPAVRRVSRRELTRTAVFTGAALLLGVACARESEQEDRDVEHSGGGERVGDGERRDFSSDRDTGEGRDTRHDADESVETVVVQTEEERREEQRRFEEERQREIDGHHRNHRGCDEPGCMAMPYGAPPSRDLIV